jgi:hypothetical protein
MNYPLSPEHMDALQKFQGRLNSEPAMEGVELTPDRKASTLVISHIEMTLDELFFGQWTTEKFQWSHIANEVQASLELVVTHPVSGQQIRRIGTASVVIMVDRVPDDIKDDPILRNRWALSADNKKPNALDMAFPKLKSECLKNASQSLGKVFGRDLNRKNKDVYRPFRITTQSTGVSALPESTMTKMIEGIKTGSDEFEIRNAMELMKDVMSEEQKNQLNQLIKEKHGE